MYTGEVIGSKKRSIIELIIVVIVVALVVTSSIMLYKEEQVLKKNKIMMLQLEKMRNDISTHTINNKSHPSGLNVVGFDTAIDPVGNTYKYDADSAWVSSGSEGYGGW